MTSVAFAVSNDFLAYFDNPIFYMQDFSIFISTYEPCFIWT